MTGMKWKQKIRQLYKRRRQGSAMIVAIVVSMVVVCFCLSLLLVSYALFQSSVRRVTQNQCRELAKTASIELEKEITSPVYSDVSSQQADLAQGKNMLWQYLRYNICQNNWPYYTEDAKTGHDADAAFRYFNLNASGGDAGSYAAMADDLSVCIYWETGDPATKDDVTLFVKVTCSKGNQTASMISTYNLVCTQFSSGESGQADDGTSSGTAGNGNITAANPSGNNIDSTECWKWSFMERE